MPSRRVFLRQASLATTGLLFSKASWFKDYPLIGLQLYTVRNDIGKDVKGTIAKVAAAGYTSVEVFGYNNGKFFGLTPEEFLAVIRQNNLKTPSGHYGMSNFLVKGDEDDLKRTIADAAKMTHDFVVVPFLTANMRTSLDDYKSLAAKLNKAGEAAKSAGMQLAYHNHNFEFKDWGGGQTGFDVFVKETDPKLVKFELDMYWATRAGKDPIQLIKANPGRISMWHIKDMASKQAPTFDVMGDQYFTEVGTGIINYKEIFKYKKESGMKYFFVEQDQVKMPVYDSIAKSLQYIKQHILS
ncbi:MAG TPA: sugar phosphate isomerase/epimerase [Puia sp.]|nr:sugar phosphate isomerase/epimerase [Puia sp.]